MTNNNNITAIAFDMIGVLVTEERLISRGFDDFFAGRLLLPIATIKERYDDGLCPGTMSRDEFWDGILDADWHAAESEFLSARAFAPDAEMISALLSRHYDLAVISDMPREWAEPILAQHHILDRLTTAAFCNDGNGSKHDGRLFQALAEQLQRPAEEILLVDDRPANLTTAHELGYHCICCPLDSSVDARPFTTIQSLSDLPRAASLRSD